MKIDKWSAFLESVALEPASIAVLTSGDVEKIVALAHSKNFNFSEQDVEDALSQLSGADGKLSDDALAAVAGGLRHEAPSGRIG
jgi:predicted ribosomally synthesized peptide with nif11-like leader